MRFGARSTISDATAACKFYCDASSVAGLWSCHMPASQVADFLIRAGRSGVTHMSGTPSHWRRALMSGAANTMSPRYIRLSGEVADQAILNKLAQFFPGSAVAHAFASTEAGVAFDVRDGLAGFPSTLISHASGKVEMRVQDDSLRIRSACVASRYLGDADLMVDADGFIDTGDTVELRGDRYYFIGRRDGVFKVGGEKVHPEEVEEVINRHPDVVTSRVRGRRSPITGTVVVADIVVQPPRSIGRLKRSTTKSRGSASKLCRYIKFRRYWAGTHTRYRWSGKMVRPKVE